MPRGMGRGGGRGGRTDYTLLKEGQTALFDEESGKNKATVWRLMGLAKKEAWVRLRLGSRADFLHSQVPISHANNGMLMQLLVIATVFLFISSLATVAVPKLAGELIDVCIKFHAGGSEGKEAAKKHLNRKLLPQLCTGLQACCNHCSWVLCAEDQVAGSRIIDFLVGRGFFRQARRLTWHCIIHYFTHASKPEGW